MEAEALLFRACRSLCMKLNGEESNARIARMIRRVARQETFLLFAGVRGGPASAAAARREVCLKIAAQASSEASSWRPKRVGISPARARRNCVPSLADVNYMMSVAARQQNY